MTLNDLIFLRAAEQDVIQAYLWYEKQEQGMDEAFIRVHEGLGRESKTA